MKADTPTRAGFQPRTAADLLMARLRERLFDGHYAPGQAVSIRKFAAEEGVSVIPARDALRALVAEGALAFRDSRTIEVPNLGPEDLNEIRFARVAVETELAGRAYPALLGSVDELQALDQQVNEALLACDAARYMAANRALHFAIYRAASAPLLMRLAESLWLRFGPSMRIVCEVYAGTMPSPDYHSVALAALAAGDENGFRTGMAADVAQGISELEKHIGGATRPAERTPA